MTIEIILLIENMFCNVKRNVILIIKVNNSNIFK